ncbi:Rad1 checkpoint protein [Carpediemonas membranifera]|uniref:Rad1 checkpoint protein n=1 Tax=Carpediemonas membranifera TaxID=201153 RepID=A0A8J6E557_9EUKA|nr:Rad1 checkpoint protein [Carpediemonas membranifera]|eukprot:KAG9395332.1 Rad1 checkpoint protein [Carpediemonas membranifera]
MNSTDAALYFETQHAILISRALEAISFNIATQQVCISVEGTEEEGRDLKFVSISPDRCLECSVSITERVMSIDSAAGSGLYTIADQTSDKAPDAQLILNSLTTSGFEPFSVRVSDLRMALDLVLPHSPPRVTFYHAGQGKPLVIVIKAHDHVLSSVQIATQPLIRDLIGVDFDPTTVTHTATLQPHALPMAFPLKGRMRIDQSNFARIRFDGESERLVIMSGSSEVEAQTEFPMDAPITVFERPPARGFESAEFGYKPAHLATAVLSAKYAHLTRLLITSEGVLNVAHLIPRETNVRCFVQFFLMPLVDALPG